MDERISQIRTLISNEFHKEKFIFYLSQMNIHHHHHHNRPLEMIWDEMKWAEEHGEMVKDDDELNFQCQLVC